MVVMYIFAHRLHDSKAWRKIPDHKSKRWPVIRYDLEQLLCKVKEKTRNPSAPQKTQKASAYIEAFFYKGPDRDWVPVPNNWYFLEEEKVWLVLRLQPMPQGFRTHVPCEVDEAVIANAVKDAEHNAALTTKFVSDMDAETDELKRIKLVSAYDAAYIHDGAACAKARLFQKNTTVGLHASEFLLEERAEDVDEDARLVRREPVPPATFKCPACDEAGHHFRAYCPLLRTKFSADDTVPEPVAPLDRLSVLKGVPMMFRAMVAPGESKTITADGLAVSMVKRNISRLDHLPVYSLLLSTGEGSAAESIRVYEEAMPAMQVSEPRGAQLDFEPHLFALESRLKDLERKFYSAHPNLVKKGPQCLHFLKGMCHKGYLACEFSHNLCVKKPVCAFFAENKCKAGEKCEFIHPERISEHMIRPDKTNGLAPSFKKNQEAINAAKEKRREVNPQPKPLMKRIKFL